MNVAVKIRKELDEKTDLKLIKKIIALYEKLRRSIGDEADV